MGNPYKPYIVGICGLYSPRIPREHHKYHKDTSRVPPVVPRWLFLVPIKGVVFSGIKDLHLEGKHRINGFQVYDIPVFMEGGGRGYITPRRQD